MKNVNKKEMKTNRTISEYKSKLILLFAVLMASSTLMAQNGENTIIKRAQKLSSSPKTSISLYDITAEILSSNNNEVRIELDYIAKGKDEEVAKLKTKLENDLLQVSSSGEVKIDLTFQNNFDLEIMGMKWSKLTFKSDKKETIKLKEFKVQSFKVWLPAKQNMTLSAKYSRVKLQTNIEGSLNLDAYDTELTAKSITGDINGQAKYSNLTFANTGEIKLSLYETKLHAENTSNGQFEAKYSGIVIKSMQDLKLDIYEGSLLVPTIANANIKSKYAELSLGSLQELKLEAYEGRCKLGDANKLTINAKYVEISGDKVETLQMLEGYENTITFDAIGSLNSKDGKYNNFSIGELHHSLSLSGYEDEIDIESISKEFKNIAISGKYIDANIFIKSPHAYRLQGIVQYPDLSIDESAYKIKKKIGDENKMEFEYDYKEVNDASPKIELHGYEMDIRIHHLSFE